MECEIVIRPARPQDLSARLDLIRSSLTEYDFDAFVLFFFQEATLEACVLCGAVLFIFMGCGVWACVCVVPASGALVCVCCVTSHRVRAARQRALLRRETFGVVAEYRGPLATAAPPRLTLTHSEPARHSYRRVVGTISVAEAEGAGAGLRAGWVRGWAVGAGWRRRGVGKALLAAAQTTARDHRLVELGAATSCLQNAARSLLHTAHWEVRGSYSRQIIGEALTLPMTQLGLNLDILT